MTFTEIQTEVLDRLNLTSAEDTARIGRAINRVYKKITLSLGLQTSRRTVVMATTTLGDRYLTFSGIEQILSITNRANEPNQVLREVLFEVLVGVEPRTDDTPVVYAINRINGTSVQIYLDCNPQTEFDLYADGYATAGTLSGSDVPVFPESFHDLLIEGVLIDEYKKLEKGGASKDSKAIYDERLGELRLHLVKSTTRDLFQGQGGLFGGQLALGGGSGGGDSFNGALSWTQTGLITFDRDPLAPFAVTSGSAVVTNLDADMLDGFHAADIAFDPTANETITGIWTFTPRVTLTGGATLSSTLLFTADNTHDIGASGATRPRDLFLGRNAVIGGTLGVTGATTLAALSATTGAFSSDLTASTGAFGTTPATAGTVRLPNAGTIQARNQANGANIELLRLDSGDRVSLGESVTNFLVGNGASPVFRFGGTTSAAVALKRSSAQLQVRLGDDSADASLSSSVHVLSENAPASPVVSTIYLDTIVKAWASIAHSAGTPSIEDDVNVTSVTDNGTGDTTVTYATSLPNATYAAVANVLSTAVDRTQTIHSRATGSVRVLTANANAGAATDAPFLLICVGG